MTEIKDFFSPKFKPILNKNRECACTFCCKIMSEGTIFYHERDHCPYLPDHNKLNQYRKLVLLICDDKLKCLFGGLLNLIKYCDPTILPTVLILEEDFDVLVKQFSLFRWRKQQIKIDVIILSSVDYDYDLDRNLTKESKIIHDLIRMLDFKDFVVKKNLLFCCVGNDNILLDPIFYELQIEWNDIISETLNSFLQVFLPNIYKCFQKSNDNNTHNTPSNSTPLIKCFLSTKTKPVTNYQPIKLSTKVLKRNEIVEVLLKTDFTTYDQKITPCYYCNLKYSLTAIKKHEKCCKFRFVDFVDAEFIVLIGIIGKTKHLGSVYAHFIHHYFPKAFISYFFVNNINELVTDVQNASFNRLKFFNESSKGRMFIFTFQQTIPRYDDLLPFFDKYENLVHVHQVVCAPVNEIMYDYTKMTPNTSLVFFNETRELVKVINMLTLCEKTDSGSFYQFQPFLAFMSDSNKADTTPQPPQIRSLPSKRSFNQRETLKITVKDLGDLFKMNKK